MRNIKEKEVWQFRTDCSVCGKEAVLVQDKPGSAKFYLDCVCGYSTVITADDKLDVPNRRNK